MGHSAQSHPDDHELNGQHQKMFSHSHILSNKPLLTPSEEREKRWCVCASSRSIHLVEWRDGRELVEEMTHWKKELNHNGKHYEKQLASNNFVAFFFERCFFLMHVNADMERRVGGGGRGGCWGNRRRRRIHRRLNLLLSSAVIEQNKDRTQYSFNLTTFTKRVKPLTLVTVSTG